MRSIYVDKVVLVEPSHNLRQLLDQDCFHLLHLFQDCVRILLEQKDLVVQDVLDFEEVVTSVNLTDVATLSVGCLSWKLRLMDQLHAVAGLHQNLTTSRLTSPAARCVGRHGWLLERRLIAFLHLQDVGSLIFIGV